MKKLIVTMALAVLGTFLLVACGGKKKVEVWVGNESKTFYDSKVEDFKAFYKDKYGKDYGYTINIVGMDTGSAATTFMDDPSVGADLFTVAHDNLGKLIAGSSAIAPVETEDLLAQIRNDNPEAFIDAVTATHSGKEYVFGIPYVAQSLVLYYDKEAVTEEQVKTWEGMMAAAKAKGDTVKAMTITGEDGFNNSFLLLATNAETKATSLKLYPNGVAADSFGAGDDTIAIMKWGQDFFSNENGGKLPDSDGWEVALKNGSALSVISGAWHFNAAKSALGSKLGIALLPKFTITEAYGTVAAGTVFQSGTFADTKMFAIKKGLGDEKQAAVEALALYFSSKGVQEESYLAANNLPAYKNAAVEFESMKGTAEQAVLATRQIEMFEHGIAQPFGKDPKFNTYYYSKGAPAIIIDILKNADGKYSTTAQIKSGLEVIQNIWRTGEQE